MKKSLVKLIKNKFFILFILIIIILIFLSIYSRVRKKESEFLTYQVKRQNLIVSVIESGNVTALKSQKIVNQVPGTRNILEVVDEGTEITEKEVKNKKVLIRLDSKDLEDKRDQLKIDVENSYASYSQALQELEITKKQNESEITQAELNVKFAKLDLEKYLGKDLCGKILSSKKIVDYKKIIDNFSLGGESWNTKKNFENKIDIAKEELERAKNNLEWSKKLAKKGYITENDLKADELSYRQKEANLEMAKLNYDLFINYDFPKNVEKLLSDYKESLNELERVKDKSKAKLIQAESSVRSKKATYLMRKSKLEEVEKQIKMCTIYATQPGFVVYPTSSMPWRTENPIQPGTSVRMYQELLNLPDFNHLGVETQVHETNVKKLKVRQKAIIRVDAFPDKVFEGTVKKISLMPDPRMKFLNPDINIYETEVAFDKKYRLLKPGMSARVEIIIEKKENVLLIPVMAIFFKNNLPYCHILKGNRVIEREIGLGESNDRMVEVKRGLKEGDVVVMIPEKIGFEVKEKERYKKGKFIPEEKPKRKNEKRKFNRTQGHKKSL